jgi:hypothetical protein
MRQAFAPLALAALMLAAAPAAAQKHVQPSPGPEGSWRFIGTTHASYTADHDTLVVQGPYDQFRRLKFKETDAPLQLQRVVVHFGNGAKQELSVREHIAQGGETRAIDLNGGERHVKRIDFWYDTKGLGKGKADVSIYGLK